MTVRVKTGSLTDWVAFKGGGEHPVPGTGARSFAFDGVTEGASIFIVTEAARYLVFCGTGPFAVSCGVTGPARLVIEGKGYTSLCIEGVPDAAGWSDGPSITDLEPRSMGAVSPEVQRMFDIMQRNMMALRAQLDQR